MKTEHHKFHEMTYSLRFKLLCFLVLQLSLFLPVQAQNLIGNGSFSNIGAGWAFFAPATATEAYLVETSYGGTAGANIVAYVDMECNLR